MARVQTAKKCRPSGPALLSRKDAETRAILGPSKHRLNREAEQPIRFKILIVADRLREMDGPLGPQVDPRR